MNAELANALPTNVLVNEIVRAGGIKRMDMSDEAVARRERAAKMRESLRRTRLAVQGN